MIICFLLVYFKLLPTSFIMFSPFKASSRSAAASSFERQPQSLISRRKAIIARGGGKLGQNIPLYVPVIVYTPISGFTRRQRCRQIFSQKKKKKKAMADGLVVFLAQSPKIKDHSLLLITTNNLKMGVKPKKRTPQGQLSNKLTVYSGPCMEFISLNSI